MGSFQTWKTCSAGTPAVDRRNASRGRSRSHRRSASIRRPAVDAARRLRECPIRRPVDVEDRRQPGAVGGLHRRVDPRPVVTRRGGVGRDEPCGRRSRGNGPPRDLEPDIAGPGRLGHRERGFLLRTIESRVVEGGAERWRRAGRDQTLRALRRGSGCCSQDYGERASRQYRATAQHAVRRSTTKNCLRRETNDPHRPAMIARQSRAARTPYGCLTRRRGGGRA